MVLDEYSPSDTKIITLAVACIAVVCFAVGYLSGSHLAVDTSWHADLPFVFLRNDQHTKRLLTSSDGLSFLTPNIHFYNEYTSLKPLAGDYPWENIVEPYRKTTFVITNPMANYTYHWYVNGWHKEDGVTTDINFGTPTGVLDIITVQIRNAVSGSLSLTQDMKVMCKYVRRELRQLLDQDRTAFFQAISIMQRIPTQIGKRMYGTKYRSKDFFNRIHLYYGGSKSCDHWHQGPGFVTSHVAFSLMYEQSLQSINPSVSLPYWDFTLESTFFTPSTFRTSGVFAPDWFGDAFCNNTDHTPVEGRFAYVPVMQNAINYSDIISPYGLLKSPWNADPSPFLSRSDRIFGLKNNLKPSGCQEYHHALLYFDWKNLAQQLNSNAHGHIHELIGGSWNPTDHLQNPPSDTFTKNNEFNKDWRVNAYQFAHATEAFSKILWRYGYLVCPEKSTNNLCSLPDTLNDDYSRRRRRAKQNNAFTDEKKTTKMKDADHSVHDEHEREKNQREEDMLERQSRKLLSKGKTTNTPSSASLTSSSSSSSSSWRPSLLSKGTKIPPSLSSTFSPSSSSPSSLPSSASSSPSSSSSSCRCECTKETLQNLTVPHILASTGIIRSLVFIDKEGHPIDNWQNKTSKMPYDQLPGYSVEESQAIYDRILEVLCNPGYIGDMFQASSTNDVTFWILHPTLDRLWHFTRLNDHNGLIPQPFDHTWTDNAASCPGHLEHDATPFKNIFDQNNTVYTNAQLYTLMDPTRDAFPYIYDHFMWNHCTHLGFDMTGSGA